VTQKAFRTRIPCGFSCAAKGLPGGKVGDTEDSREAMLDRKDVPFRLPSMNALSRIAADYRRHRIVADETIGVFRIKQILNRQGNVSTVYLAEATVEDARRNIRRGGRYIIKGIPYHPSTSSSTNARNLRSFFNEIRILPFVSNPAQHNIVALVDANSDPDRGKLFMALEELAYQSVREKYPDKRLDPDIVLHFSNGLTRALTHLHSLGIVHGDIKPDNFMVDTRGEAILVDFGSSFFTGKGSRRRGEIHPPDPDEYREPFTPLYCSPELARYKMYGGATNPKDERSDAWALGITLHELLTGERPFSWKSNESLSQILEEIGRGTLPLRLERLKELEASSTSRSTKGSIRFLMHIIGRLVEPDSGKRLSCMEAQSEIYTFLASKGLEATPKPQKPQVQSQLDVARQLARLDEPIKTPTRPGEKTRRRTTAAMELKTLEMREAYLKSKSSRRKKGWFLPPAGQDQPPPPPPPKQGAGKEKKPLSKPLDDFEAFRKKQSGKSSKERVSFEDFVQKRKSEEIEKMKAFCEEGGDTQLGRDTRDSTKNAASGDLADTAVDADPKPRGKGKPERPKGEDENVDAQAETRVDPEVPLPPRRKRPPDPEATQDE